MDTSGNVLVPGKIYAIRSNQTPKYYIGSTTQSLAARMNRHRDMYRQAMKGSGKASCRSGEILRYEDARIELLEDFPCATVDDLRAREGVLIRQFMADIVNKNRPNRTRQEYLDYLREWRARNPEYQRKWHEAHPGYGKAWREAKKAEVAV
jgi:hypothetical protein